MDHARALGHAGERVGFVGAGGEGELPGEELGEGVSGADGARSVEPRTVGRREDGASGRDTEEDFLDG